MSSGGLTETFKNRIRGLLKEQARAQSYDEEGFLSYVEQALTSDNIIESEKKQLLQDCLVRLMPPGEAAQLCSLIIVLYNQLYPSLINLQVTPTGWLVCPFGPHILPASTMKKHLNLNHFEQMKGYSYDNGRLVPLNAPPPPSSSSSASSSSSSSSSPQQPQEHVPASQVLAALSERNLAAQQKVAGMGRGSRTPSSDWHGPQPTIWQQSGGSLPPLEFIESEEPTEAPSQSVEEIQQYLPELFDGKEFQGITASVFDICYNAHYSQLICARLQGASPETRRLFLKEILPEVVGLSCNQSGSAILRDMIDQGTTKQRQMIFSQLEDSFVKLAVSSSGSQLLNSLMLHLSGNDMLDLAIEELKAGLSEVMSSPFGSSLVVDILPNLSAAHSALLFDELLRNFGELIKDPVASSGIATVVQRRLSTGFNASVFKKLKGSVIRYSQDDHAFKIVKVFIKNGPAQNRRLIVDEIINTSTLGSRAIVQLTQSPSGRFVVQAILESGDEDQKKALAKQIQDDLKEKELLVAKNQKSTAAVVASPSASGPKTPMARSASSPSPSPSPAPSPSASSTSLDQLTLTPQTDLHPTPRAAIPRPLISQISIPDEDYFSSSSTSLSTSQMSSPDLTPESTPPRRKSPEPLLKIDDSIPVPFVGTPFINQDSILGLDESLVPDSERGEYWTDDGPVSVVPLHPQRGASARREDPVIFTNPTQPKKFASETVVTVSLDEEDLSEDELYQMYPDLGEASGEDESGDDDDENPQNDWKRFDWTLYDFDIQDYFQPEWSETDMLEQQDYMSFLNILGLEGEEAEGIRWKPNDLCEAKLSEDSDKWFLGKVVKTAKDHSKCKVWFPLLGTNKVEVVTANCMRPALKQLGAETFHVLEGSDALSSKGFGGFKSVGGSRPKKR